MWDLVPWAARWAEGQSEKSQKYLADDAHKNMWVPLPHVGSQKKAVYLEEPISSGYPAQTGLIGKSVRPSVCPIQLRLCSTNIVIDVTAPQT